MNERYGKDRDVDLMERLKNGDQSAMQVLYTRHYQRIYRFILRQLKDETMAEDIVNEVFLDCWRSASKFEGRSSVTTWLTAISYNKSISYLRKRKEAQMGDGQAEAMVDDADSPQTELMKGDKGDKIRSAISKLSKQHAAVIDLAYYHEMSINEIAEVLDVPANTIKTRLFHARKNLHEILCDEGVDRGWP